MVRFGGKVPPQDAYLALIMYDNLNPLPPVYIKFREIPSQYTYLEPPSIRHCRVPILVKYRMKIGI